MKKRSSESPATSESPKGTEKENTGKPDVEADKLFPIVGIGASAGGLEAFQQFLSGVPENSGLAYVVVQHLDPNHEGILPELLQRATGTPVHQAKNRQRVEPNCIYVIPPNKDMSILHGVLHLFDLPMPRGLHLPIDFFFRTLASDRQQRSIGIILSGMGSDGTMGLRAIREKGGLTLAQEPETAKFEAMPRSVIEAKLADIVAAPQEMAGRILAHLHQYKGAPAVAREPELDSQAKGALDKIVILLRIHTGHDFSQYKRSTLYRRVERRMSIHQIKPIAHFVQFLRENPQEVDLLFKELLIGVTNFFRDPEAWNFLAREVMPVLIQRSPPGTVLRAWVPACSTGEEAYSLAIVFEEALQRIRPPGRLSLQIYATDLDRSAIETARAGFYSSNIAADVSPERLNRFFVAEGDGYRVGKEIREMLIFAPQNVIMDPPFTRLDVLSCRNLLIYLEPDLQRKLLPLFHYSLKPGGILFLGSAETVGSSTDLFTPLDSKARIYSRLANAVNVSAFEFPTRAVTSSHDLPAEGAKPVAVAANFQAHVDRFLLQHLSPAAVLTNSDGDIVYINGRTGKFLEAVSGKANWNIHAMAHEGLRHKLSAAFQKAVREKRIVTVSGVVADARNGQGPFTVDLRVEAIVEYGPLNGMVMIVFHEVAPNHRPEHGAAGGNVRDLELELEAQEAREQLQSMREEMQSSQEELKSANEELQSTNEELQSTNEELTTSKEEMQSLNEELQTVNAELQSKVDDLSRTSSDMKNLLDSTDIATVFLDSSLNVRRFTLAANRIIKLIPSDVGRPLGDIVTELDYPDLLADAREVLRTLVFSSKEVAASKDRYFTVRIMPYRTTDNKIDGVVITFVDFSAAKRMELDLRKAQQRD